MRAKTARASALVTLVVASMVAGSACHRTKVQSGLTGVNVTVHYDPGLSLTALKMSGWIGSAPAFTPGRLPDPPRALTSGTESAAILVPVGLAGNPLRLRVDGLAGEVIAGSAQVVVALKSAELVNAEVTLGAPAICGDRVIQAPVEECDDGNATAGDGCTPDCFVEGCGLSNCAGGCCQDGVCQPRALGTCGTAGLACSVCPPARADTCSEAGGCACGSGPACGEGQVCLHGACTCDSSSCPDGCCQGAACVVPGLGSCAPGGGRCSPCDPTKADRCDGKGACACGVGPACAPGQRCAGGQCVCDGTSCPSGCCHEATCATRSLTSCGSGGQTCAACDARSDSCSAAGTCRCGGGAVCGSGQRCLGGTCVCDGTSCPGGCCSQGVCLAGDSADSCGTGGNRCDACPAGQACTDGRCSGCSSATCSAGCCSGNSCNPPSLVACGTGGGLCVGCDARRADACSATGACTCGGKGQCADGSRCMDGVCVCKPASCPSGCCLNGACIPPAVNYCGSAGGTCTDCGPTVADSCTAAGSCGCGAGPACAARQHCVAGSCVCDFTSCPNGCCEGNICRMPSVGTCAIGASACLDCGIKADRCPQADGVCHCGGGPACADGARCQAGTCVCDGASCPGGCCSGSTCIVGTDPTACGTGGAACQNCGGGSCMSGVCSTCTSATCDGCCSGTNCTHTGMVSLQACGARGAACVACDPSRADGCSDAGICMCGGQPACGAGKSCVLGACVCDARACPTGCCASGACQTPSLGACGVGGGSCAPCSPDLADTCDTATGTCRCGTNPACAAGTVCRSGSCVCNQTSCPSGCCANGVCKSPPTSLACGVLGETCIACDATSADSCDATTGTCRCGSNPQCAAGSHCLSGACVADPP